MDLKGKLTRKEMLKLSGGALAGASFLSLAAGCGSGGGNSSSGSKTLTLGSIGWTEDVAVSNLTKILLQDNLGYKVQVQGPLDAGPLFQGVASGQLNAFQDAWLPNNENYLKKPQIKNQVELLKPWYQGVTKYGICVPNYMSNIKSLADLNKAGTNEITGIEPGASFMPVIKNKVIPGYNLNMKLVTSSTAGMLAQLQRKYSAKQPIVFTGWSPHWMNTKYAFHYLEDPKGLEKPFSNESRIAAVVNKNLKSNDPKAYAFVSAIRLNEDQVNQIEAEMNKAGQGKEEQGVRNWLKSHQSVVKPWVQAAKKA